MLLMSCLTTRDDEPIDLLVSQRGAGWTRLDTPCPLPTGLRAAALLTAETTGGVHLLALSETEPDKILHCVSDDLRQWSPPRTLAIPPGPAEARPRRCVDAYVDPDKGLYRVIWSVGEPDDAGGRGVWASTSANLTDWTDPVLLFDAGFAIGAVSATRGRGGYLMAFTDRRGEDKPGTYFRAIRTAGSPMAAGPFMRVSSLLTPRLTRRPALCFHAGRWLLVYERYEPTRLEALASEDGRTWRDITASVHLPRGRRPSLCAVDEAIARRALES